MFSYVLLARLVVHPLVYIGENGLRPYQKPQTIQNYEVEKGKDPLLHMHVYRY